MPPTIPPASSPNDATISVVVIEEALDVVDFTVFALFGFVDWRAEVCELADDKPLVAIEETTADVTFETAISVTVGHAIETSCSNDVPSGACVDTGVGTGASVKLR